MDQHSKLGYREGLVSVILNLLLFVLKYYAGIASASLALIADAWHTLSDSLTSLVVILGIKLSSKKPDKEHPFGHGRWEQISALIIAILLALVGVESVSYTHLDGYKRQGITGKHDDDTCCYHFTITEFIGQDTP